jgi:hypothetical protein
MPEEAGGGGEEGEVEESNAYSKKLNFPCSCYQSIGN